MPSPARQRVKDEKIAEARPSRRPTPPPSPARRSTSTASFDFHSHKYHVCGGSSCSSNTETHPGAVESSKPEEDSGASELAKDASISPAPLQKSQSYLESSMKDLFIVESWREYSEVMEEAWERLKNSIVYYRGKPMGTSATMDSTADALNYNQVYVRDFVPAGLAYLMKDPAEPGIVKNFLIKTLHLQSSEKMVDNFMLGEGVLPASFKVLHDSPSAKENIIADFGGSAIGRVAPVDSGFWWIILLRAYTKSTNDFDLANLPEVQNGMKLILKICLSDGFDTFPTLLCADGCCMIDRRMGIYAYPLEIQALFYFALRCAKQLLKPETAGKELLERIDKRMTGLSFHIQKYYGLDFTQLNLVYRYKTEEYSHTAVNKFNVMPESIPDGVLDFMPSRGGYLIGNVSPDRMWFSVGNCVAILSCLATPDQAFATMNLIEERWDALIGEMPLKIAYPALEGDVCMITTGHNPKNSWPSAPTLHSISTTSRVKCKRGGEKRRGRYISAAQRFVPIYRVDEDGAMHIIGYIRPLAFNNAPELDIAVRDIVQQHLNQGGLANFENPAEQDLEYIYFTEINGGLRQMQFPDITREYIIFCQLLHGIIASEVPIVLPAY